MTTKELKSKLFWGYIEYVQKNSGPAKVIKFTDYLTEELNYTPEEALEIFFEIRKDSIDEN